MAKPADWSRPIGDIVADIRQKLVEEGWFGKAVTGRRQNISIDTAGEQSPAVKLGWSVPGQHAQSKMESGWFDRGFAAGDSRDTDGGERAQRTQEQERGIER